MSESTVPTTVETATPSGVDPATAAPAVVDVPLLVARDLALSPRVVRTVLALMADGGTVPFIARYRKEQTGGLDEVQLRAIEERHAYRRELEDRRAAIAASIAEQGKLTAELAGALARCETKAQLEDLYAPYRPRRRTRAQAARDKGLEPLALRLLAQPDDGDPTAEATALLDEARVAAGQAAVGLVTAAEALAGARDIAADVIADTAAVRSFARKLYVDTGDVVAEVVPGKDAEPTKFEQYYAHRERAKAIPSHRFLAIRRGEAEGVLRAAVVVDAAKVTVGIERLVGLREASPFAAELRQAVADAVRRLLAPAMENDLRADLKLRSDAEAVDVFARNLHNLMMSPPLGARPVVGIDPGLRTGCKCAAVDGTGRFLGSITIFPSHGDAGLAKAKVELLAFLQTHGATAIAVGNGTGGREAEALVRGLVAEHALTGTIVVSVNEAGASVYSASDLAREEFPDLDLTIRGAISIARRLQDPLSELVKVEPKAIGVGQYQHDVHQPLLTRRLAAVVEDGVNAVGVDLNTASAQLLEHVAGVGPALAKKVVAHRDAAGAFASRQALLEVAGLGPKTFEQAAGFLRVRGGTEPLDASGIHPERYPLVRRIAGDLGVEVGALVGDATRAAAIDVARYVDDEVGEPTVRDIVAELGRPGRDPRPVFEPPKFRDDVTELEHLKPGMVLEGVVTNVTAFGAFVDLGVHQDGLIHVSQLSDTFVKDPSEAVKAGQRITVRVLEVDLARKRIALTARRNEPAPRGPRNDGPRNHEPRQDRPRDDRPRGPRPDGPRGPRDGQPRAPRTAPPSPPRDGAPASDAGARPAPRERGARPGWDGRTAAPAGGGAARPPRAPDTRGPRPDDRGPRSPRPDDRGARGPRPDDRGARGPRPDDRRGPPPGPRHDDRGPLRPPAPAVTPPGYGIAGFVNNPFANLGGKKK